jgi:hypothetical protein
MDGSILSCVCASTTRNQETNKHTKQQVMNEPEEQCCWDVVAMNDDDGAMLFFVYFLLFLCAAVGVTLHPQQREFSVMVALASDFQKFENLKNCTHFSNDHHHEDHHALTSWQRRNKASDTCAW